MPCRPRDRAGPRWACVLRKLARRRPRPRFAYLSSRVFSPRTRFPSTSEMASSTTRRRSTKVTVPRTPAPLVIECVKPELDCGRYPVKRVVGDTVEVRADILKDGHDLLDARIRYS